MRHHSLFMTEAMIVTKTSRFLAAMKLMFGIFKAMIISAVTLTIGMRRRYLFIRYLFFNYKVLEYMTSFRSNNNANNYMYFTYYRLRPAAEIHFKLQTAETIG